MKNRPARLLVLLSSVQPWAHGEKSWSLLPDFSTNHRPGQVERFYQTLKRWLAKQPTGRTLRELQAQLDRFRAYPDEFGHAERWGGGRPRPRTLLCRKAPRAVRRCPRTTGSAKTGSTEGGVTLRHDSRLHHIKVGRRHAGTRVVMLVAGPRRDRGRGGRGVEGGARRGELMFRVTLCNYTNLADSADHRARSQAPTAKQMLPSQSTAIRP